MEPQAAPAAPRRSRLLTLENAALAYSALTAFAMALGVQLSPHGTRPVVDERSIIDWAVEIAGGRLIGNEPFYIDPLAAYVFAGLFKLTGGSLFAGRLFYVCLGVGTVALVGALGRTLFGRREGLGAMWLLALYGPHTFILGFILKEALAVHLTAWALLLGVWIQNEDARIRTWALFGLTAGFLVLSRGHYAALVPLLGLWTLWQAARGKGEPRVRGLRLLVFCLGLAFPLSLSSAHNWAAAKSWLPITVMGGQTFWIGNNPLSSGAYETYGFSKGLPESERDDYRAEAARRVGRPLTLRESSNYWMGEGVKFWTEHTGAALKHFFKKLWLVVHDYEIPDNYGFTCFRRFFTPSLWFTPLGFGSLLGLSIVGAVSAVRASRQSRFVVGFMLIYGFWVAVFLVLDRYRIPLSLGLALFSARALVVLADRVKARNFSGLQWPALVVAAATLLAFVPTAISKQAAGRDAWCVAQAGLLLYSDGRPAEAEQLFDEARRLDNGARWIEEDLQKVRILKPAQPLSP